MLYEKCLQWRPILLETSSRLLYDLTTLFLFCKSDIKTTLFPMSTFAYGSAPLCSVNRISYAGQAFLWTWLHLLHFNLANQTRDPAEDLQNKPWRPLPSGRISHADAKILRWVCMTACLSLSLYYSLAVFATSLFFTFLIPAYHELHFDGHWLMKNILNAMGYSCFALGSTLVAGCDRSSVDSIGRMSLITMASILATTIQTQDFQDVEGDSLVGRKTLPIVSPNLSRYSPLLMLTIWTLYLNNAWNLDFLSGSALIVLAVVTGIRFYLYRTAAEDHKSYILYNIWLGLSFALPGYYRIFRATAV